MSPSTTEKELDYAKTCFVIMPFGKKYVERPAKRPTPKKKTVTERIDFDAIYETIFRPAIHAVKLPEGGKLVARRADKDYYTGIITREMYGYIEYSRFAVADITGLNANVFLELGQRYRARESGTAVFRQTDATIPFDINQVKAMPYEYAPANRAAASRALIRRVLSESLVYNRLDSPIWEALQKQQSGADIDDDLRQAEECIRRQDWVAAEQLYQKALARQPMNSLLHFKVGLMRRDQGRWDAAIEAFSTAVKALPKYAEAHRELGIALNKRFGKTKQAPDGIAELERSVQLKPDDFDALASLGGALRRAGRDREALQCYRRAVDASLGHPYPLLNVMKLEAIVEGKQVRGPERELQLKRADKFRRGQAEHDPPIDAPWSFFDLAEIQIYLGSPEQAIEILDKGLLCCSHRWQAETFRRGLEQLAAGLTAKQEQLPAGLEAVIARLRQAEPQLPD